MVYFRESVARTLRDLGAKANVPLSDLVSFRVGGPAAVLLRPEGEAALCRALNVCREAGIPVILLGNGTNVLPSDEGFDGAIMLLGSDFARISRDGDRIWECGNCGHIHVGSIAPELCPVCAHPRAYFALRATNY